MALTDNLTAYWKFDETTGTSAADATGNGNTGTLVGTIKPTWVSGKINNALQFDAVNDAVNIGILSPTGAATWSAWVYPTGNNANYRAIFANWTPAMVIFVGQLITTSTSLTVYFNGSLIYNIDNFFTPSTWVHLAMSHTGSNVKTYKNGIEVGSAAATLNTPTGVTSIGGDIGRGNYYWKGMIDEVGLWSRALSATEINTLYNGGAGLQYPFTVGFNIALV